CKHYNSLPLTF
nr:immunoglobulin light chain junction region [Macaca mulatta]